MEDYFITHAEFAQKVNELGWILLRRSDLNDKVTTEEYVVPSVGKVLWLSWDKETESYQILTAS